MLQIIPSFVIFSFVETGDHSEQTQTEYVVPEIVVKDFSDSASNQVSRETDLFHMNSSSHQLDNNLEKVLSPNKKSGDTHETLKKKELSNEKSNSFQRKNAFKNISTNNNKFVNIHKIASKKGLSVVNPSLQQPENRFKQIHVSRQKYPVKHFSLSNIEPSNGKEYKTSLGTIQEEDSSTSTSEETDECDSESSEMKEEDNRSEKFYIASQENMVNFEIYSQEIWKNYGWLIKQSFKVESMRERIESYIFAILNKTLTPRKSSVNDKLKEHLDYFDMHLDTLTNNLMSYSKICSEKQQTVKILIEDAKILKISNIDLPFDFDPEPCLKSIRYALYLISMEVGTLLDKIRMKKIFIAETRNKFFPKQVYSQPGNKKILGER